jgi:hypothetical protein
LYLREFVMARPKTNTKGEREERLAKVARFYLFGWTQTRIGNELIVSQQQISYDLKIVRQRWLESSIRDFNEAKAQELAKLDLVEARYWAAWERTQEIDPRFLQGVERCIAKRCEILGLNAPLKQAWTDATGRASYGPFLTDEERRSRLLALFQQNAPDVPG